MKTAAPMRVGAPVFCGLEPGADAPKFVVRSKAMASAARRLAGFCSLPIFRTKETGVAKRAGPVSLVRFVGQKSDKPKYHRPSIAAEKRPGRSSHSNRLGCSPRPTQNLAALRCQGLWSATSRGIASGERSQLDVRVGCGQTKWIQAALAKAVVSRSGSKTVLFLSIK